LPRPAVVLGSAVQGAAPKPLPPTLSNPEISPINPSHGKDRLAPFGLKSIVVLPVVRSLPVFGPTEAGGERLPADSDDGRFISDVAYLTGHSREDAGFFA